MEGSYDAIKIPPSPITNVCGLRNINVIVNKVSDNLTTNFHW